MNPEWKDLSSDWEDQGKIPIIPSPGEGNPPRLEKP